MTVMTGTTHCSPGTSNYWTRWPRYAAVVGTNRVQQGRIESSPIRGISTDTESQIRGRRGGGVPHAPFRRVMKRPASDMTGESNCVYNRGRWYSRPSRHSASTSFRRRSDDPSTSFRLSRRPPHWHGPADDNVAYSNFIVGPFGIPVDGPRAPFDPS